jgi:phosphoenolpyruvate carboxylase
VGLQLRLLPLLLLVLQVTGHSRLLETNPSLRCLIEMRNPYIDPINILQVTNCCSQL